jgi:hypothetical protein
MSYSSAFFDDLLEDSLSSAKIAVPLVLKLVHPSSVIDVGSATGAWLSVFHDHGIRNILGLDGAYVDRSKLLIPPDFFRAADLTKPFSLSERFDLAMSLEVAEHLPAGSAGGFIRSLCQLAPIVLFSAAVPGQGGEHHMNEQWPEYWRRLFAKENFRMFDPFRPLLWGNERVASHYRQNMFLFVHDDILRARSELSQLPEVKCGNGLMLVDAHILFGLRATLKRLPYIVWTSVRRRIKRLPLKRNG